MNKQKISSTTPHETTASPSQDRLERIQRFVETFSICRLRVRARAQTALYLPEYKGSMLRSAVALAIRDTVCRVPGREGCLDCSYVGGCPFAPLAEPEAWLKALGSVQRGSVPAALLVEPPLDDRRRREPGEELRFSIVLFGVGVSLIEAVLGGVERLGERGLGSGRGMVEIEDMELEELPVSIPATHLFEGRPHDATLDLLTPLCHKTDGQITRVLTARGLLFALRRRLNMLSRLFGPGGDPLPYPEMLEPLPELGVEVLEWAEWDREPADGKRVTYGGFVGRIHLHGALDVWGPLIALGEGAHIGKNAVFGMGGYRVAQVS